MQSESLKPISVHVWYGDSPANFSLSSAWQADFLCVPREGETVWFGTSMSENKREWIVQKVTHTPIEPPDEETMLLTEPGMSIILRPANTPEP